MKYLAVLGRQPKISLAELECLFSDVNQLSLNLATFSSDNTPDIDRLGGSLKIAEKLEIPVLEHLKNLPEGKITLGISDYSKNATKKTAWSEALKLKKILKRFGRSVRVLENKEATLSTAISHHNQLAEKKNHVEIIKYDKEYYLVLGVQNITAYSKRDQARPARDAKVGMLPPKLAQILINFCGPLKKNSIILDPFCGTGVVLQEALLMGFTPYGTDLSDRMVEYSKKNLKWLAEEKNLTNEETYANMEICIGDAIDFEWQKIDAVACETYLGPPMSTIPPDIKLKSAKQECKPIILGFLKNLSTQIKKGTPVAIAVPAWLKENGEYSRLNILDEIENLGYNVLKLKNSSEKDLLYHREGQIVARELIILRKN
ncbi:methyltransferase domain-containing protein [Candidatus Saccharibacteria bacterium]|nr:methyltransferase domain-containing protein [Candidatus Saccharibacteria bacterium]